MLFFFQIVFFYNILVSYVFRPNTNVKKKKKKNSKKKKNKVDSPVSIEFMFAGPALHVLQRHVCSREPSRQIQRLKSTKSYTEMRNKNEIQFFFFNPQ